MKYKLIILTLTLSCFFAFSQPNDNFDRNKLGEEFAKKFLISSLIGNEFNIIDKFNVIPNKETAISIAENILFNIYGKENIIKERPYEIYLINNYWVIFGTLPKNWEGGIFKIIINSKSGQVILIGHDK